MCLRQKFSNDNKFLQEQVRVPPKEADKLDASFKVLFAQSDLNERFQKEGVKNILEQSSLEEVPQDHAIKKICSHYQGADASWRLEQNVFCYVAYLYTVFCFLFEAVKNVIGLCAIEIADNLQLLTHCIVLICLCFMAQNKHSEATKSTKIYGELDLLNRFMPIWTFMAYLLFYGISACISYTTSDWLFVWQLLVAVFYIGGWMYLKRYKCECQEELAPLIDCLKQKQKELENLTDENQ